jgi:hypothetical protein
MKATMTVEDAVRWAYRDELPKAEATRGKLGPAGHGNGSASANVASEYWCVPDNRFGVVPFLQCGEDPARDAVAIYNAVQQLDQVPVVINAAWTADMPDLPGLGTLVEQAILRAMEQETMLVGAKRVLRRPVSMIVRDAALIGIEDGRLFDLPVVRTVMDHGRPKYFRRVMVPGPEGSFEAEVDGFDRKRRIPYPDAYTKTFLDPDLTPVFCERAVYQTWRAAMDVLFEDLAGQLAEVDLLPCVAPRAPWRAGPVTVLQDLRPESRPPRRRAKRARA